MLIYILIWDNKPSHTCTGILYEYIRMGRHIRVYDKYAYGIPVKTLLQDLARKGPFFLHPARSCKILRDLVGFCRNLAGFLHKILARILQDSCKIPQCKILQDLAGVQDKRTFSCKTLQERFYWDGTTFLTRFLLLAKNCARNVMFLAQFLHNSCKSCKFLARKGTYSVHA